MQNPKETVSSRYNTSLKSIKRNKPFNPFSDESCYILMLVTHSSQNRVFWQLYKFWHPLKNTKSAQCFLVCLGFFGWRGPVVVYFKQAWCWKVQSLNSENSTLPFIKMLFTESINKQLLMCKFPRSLRGIHWLAGPARCRNSFNCWGKKLKNRKKGTHHNATKCRYRGVHQCKFWE